MIVLQISQGHYQRLDGEPRDAVLTTFAQNDAAFVKAHPETARYHRPCWREIEVPDQASAPWGFEWYEYDENNRLAFHSANYDSSD